MHSGDVSPWKGERSDDVTQGDDGEQLIANVLLATMVSQLYSDAAAKAYIERAYALATKLARRSVTYRPSQVSKFARLSFEVDGQIETSLVSVINDALAVPTFSAEKMRSNLLPSLGAIRFINIELVRFVLRLRTQRIVGALGPLLTTTSQAALFQTAEQLITECLRHEVRSEEPLDRASDCFILAHDLVGKRNYPLAGLLLTNAIRALDTHLNSNQSPDHYAVIHSMKGKIGLLLKEITQTAA
jgi:hypothetical protein